MSKIKDRIEEIERITKRSRRINNSLWAVVAITVLASIGLGVWASIEKKRAEEAEQVAEAARLQIAKNDSITQLKLNALVERFVNDDWEIAKESNSLQTYANYAAKHPEENNDSINLMIGKLLNKRGFVQIVETKGNVLFKPEGLSENLDGEFISMIKSVNVRAGQWDTPGYNNKVGVVPKGQIIKIIEKFPSDKSSSVWAEIAF
jgi:hypothetical protein